MEKIYQPLWYLAAAITTLAFGFTIRSNADLWWHIAAGREILQQHPLQSVDTWSYTSQASTWLNHEWLADLVYALWIEAFSLESLVYWKWGILTITFLLFYSVLKQISSSHLLSFIGLAVTLLLSAPYLDMRPQMYSFLFVSILLYLHYTDRLWSLLTPLLFLLWANIHAGAILGIFIIATFAFSRRSTASSVSRRLSILALSCVALLGNPSGTSFITYPLQYAFQSNGDFSLLSEWQSPLVSYSFGGLTLLLALFLLGLISCIFSFTKAKHRSEAFLFLLLFAMAIKSERFIPFAALLLPIILLHTLPQTQKRLPRLLEGVFLVLFLSCASIYTFSFPLNSTAFAFMVRQDKSPVVMCQFLQAQNLSGNVFAKYRLAAHIPYCTQGRMKVFIDGRADTVYSPEIFATYRSIYKMNLGWENQLLEAGTDFVLWTKKGKFPSALKKSPNWEILFEDHVSYLFERTDRTTPHTLSPFTPKGPYAALHQAIELSKQHRYKEGEQALKFETNAPEVCRTEAKLIAYQNRFEESYLKLQECKELFPHPTRITLLNDTEKRLRQFAPWGAHVILPQITLY